MNYSPTTQHLADIKNRLTPFGLPIYFKLPDSSVLEPFLVIGANSSTTNLTAQVGAVIESHSVQIDVYLPASDGRTVAEEVKSRLIRLLGRNQTTTANVLMDDTIGREVYHIVIRFSENII